MWSHVKIWACNTLPHIYSSVCSTCNQFCFLLHRKVLELDFTHVVSHIKSTSTLAVSLLVVSKTKPFSVCFPYRKYFMGAFQFATYYHPLIGYSVGCRNNEYWLRFFVIRTLMPPIQNVTTVRD